MNGFCFEVEVSGFSAAVAVGDGCGGWWWWVARLQQFKFSGDVSKFPRLARTDCHHRI